MAKKPTNKLLDAILKAAGADPTSPVSVRETGQLRLILSKLLQGRSLTDDNRRFLDSIPKERRDIVLNRVKEILDRDFPLRAEKFRSEVRTITDAPESVRAIAPRRRPDAAALLRQRLGIETPATPQQQEATGRRIAAEMEAEDIRTGTNRNFPGTPTGPAAATGAAAREVAEEAAEPRPGLLHSAGRFARTPVGAGLLGTLGAVAAGAAFEQAITPGSRGRQILFGEDSPQMAEARRQAQLAEALRIQNDRREKLMLENARRVATHEPLLFQQLLHKRKMIEGDIVYGGGQDRSALNKVLLAMSEGQIGGV